MSVVIFSNNHVGVIKVIQSGLDSVDLVGSSNLSVFIEESKQRNKFYDRFIIIESVIPEGSAAREFSNLRSYIEDYCPALEVVFGTPRDKGSELVDLFFAELDAPMYTVAYLPDKVMTKNLVDLVSKSVLELKASYYEIDKHTVTKKPKVDDKKKKVEPKKVGFFGKLFGRGRKEELVEEQVEEIKEEVTHQKPQQENEVSNPLPEISSLVKDLPQVEEVASQTISPLSSVLSDIPETTETGTSDILSFGEYGEYHAQTGYIGEEDEEDITPSETSSWESVSNLQAYGFSSLSTENSVSSNFTEKVQSLNEGGFSGSESSTQSMVNSVQRNGFSAIELGTLGVTLVVGDESSEFLGKYLKERTGYLVLDTRQNSSLLPYLDQDSYFNSQGEVYTEGGNEYILNVSVSDVNSYLESYLDSSVLVNVSIDDFDRLVSSISLPVTSIVILAGSQPKVESQLLRFEHLSDKASILISNGSAYLTDLSDKSFLNSVVFSKINWKGIIR